MTSNDVLRVKIGSAVLAAPSSKSVKSFLKKGRTLICWVCVPPSGKIFRDQILLDYLGRWRYQSHEIFFQSVHPGVSGKRSNFAMFSVNRGWPLQLLYYRTTVMTTVVPSRMLQRSRAILNTCTNSCFSMSTDILCSRLIKAAVVDPVGRKTNWSRKMCSKSGGTRTGYGYLRKIIFSKVRHSIDVTRSVGNLHICQDDSISALAWWC